MPILKPLFAKPMKFDRITVYADGTIAFSYKGQQLVRLKDDNSPDSWSVAAEGTLRLLGDDGRAR